MSPILVTLTSRSDSNFEQSNISLKENKWDGDDLHSNGLDYCVRKNEGQIRWFSADCIKFQRGPHVDFSFAELDRRSVLLNLVPRVVSEPLFQSSSETRTEAEAQRLPWVRGCSPPVDGCL